MCGTPRILSGKKEEEVFVSITVYHNAGAAEVHILFVAAF